jgi:predicted transcriptional regulator
MVKTTVYLDDEIAAALKSISRKSARPQAQLIRDALREFTTAGNSAPPLPAGMGMFDSGRSDTVRRRKQLLLEAARAGRWRS